MDKPAIRCNISSIWRNPASATCNKDDACNVLVRADLRERTRVVSEVEMESDATSSPARVMLFPELNREIVEETLRWFCDSSKFWLRARDASIDNTIIHYLRTLLFN